MPTDISREIQSIWALYPEGHRSPAEVRELLVVIGAEFRMILDRTLELQFKGRGAGGATDQIIAELNAFQARLAVYETAVESAATEAELAPSIRGLFYRGQNPVPDAVFVPYVANQLEELATLIDRKTFAAVLSESLSELPERVGTAIGAAGAAVGSGATSLLSGLLSGAGVWLIPAGLLLWYLSTKGKRS